MTKKILLPFELVYLIADYHDYDKYCKPQHKEKYQDVIADIYSMGQIMPFISPKIAYEFWGSGLAYKGLNDLIDYENYWAEIMDMDAYGEELMDEYFTEIFNES